MSYETLVVEKRPNGVAVLTMNRPERMNAWNQQMRREWREAVPAIAGDAEVRALVITGAGEAFSAGADQAQRPGQGGAVPAEEIQANNLHPLRALSHLFYSVEKPLIAAVNGVCAGGGLAVVAAADVVIASERARFRVAHARLGMGIMDGMGWLLTRRIGEQRTFELYATNRIMDAREAERTGLVLRVTPHGDLMREALALAESIAKGPPLGLLWAKRALRHSHTHTFEDYLEFERLVYMTCYYSEDSREARKAFLEKREPVYRGK